MGVFLAALGRGDGRLTPWRRAAAVKTEQGVTGNRQGRL